MFSARGKQLTIFDRDGHHLLTVFTDIFSRGSVFVNFTLRFNSMTNSPLKELEEGISDGRLGDYPVVPNSLSLAGEGISSLCYLISKRTSYTHPKIKWPAFLSNVAIVARDFTYFYVSFILF